MFRGRRKEKGKEARKKGREKEKKERVPRKILLLYV